MVRVRRFGGRILRLPRDGVSPIFSPVTPLAFMDFLAAASLSGSCSPFFPWQRGRRAHRVSARGVHDHGDKLFTKAIDYDMDMVCSGSCR
jgi:hypothetical protein